MDETKEQPIYKDSEKFKEYLRELDGRDNC